MIKHRTALSTCLQARVRLLNEELVPPLLTQVTTVEIKKSLSLHLWPELQASLTMFITTASLGQPPIKLETGSSGSRNQG